MTIITRSAVPTCHRTATVRRTTADFRLAGPRSVPRLTPTAPLRPPEPPVGPSLGDVWRAFEEADLWLCTYCDVPLGGKVVGEVDHVIPLAEGGLHTMSNLTPSCRECNRTKSARSVEDWLTELAGQMSTEREPSLNTT